MAGLGQRLLGAGLAGLGAGIVQQAATARKEALMRLQKKWADERDASAREHDVSMFDRRRDASVEDRDASAGLTREGWDRADARADASADLTREGWDRADARAGPAGSSRLVTVRGKDGKPRFVPESQAAGAEAWQKPTADRGPQLKILKEDLEGNITWGLFSQEAGGFIPVGVVDKQGGIVEDATAGQGDDGPSIFQRMLSTLGFGEDESQGQGERDALVRTAKDGSRWRQDPRSGDWIEVAPAPGSSR